MIYRCGIVLCLALLLWTAPLHAATLKTFPQVTKIFTDPKTGALLFIVNGREEARLDATGFHVRQGVAYGGTLTETGPDAYDHYANQDKKR